VFETYSNISESPCSSANIGDIGDLTMIVPDEEIRAPALHLTTKQMAANPKYPWLTEQGLRHLIFQSRPRLRASGEIIPGNGLSVAIVKVGRRVLIDIAAFDKWLDSQRVGKFSDLGSEL
jgi:hypothetical protein